MGRMFKSKMLRPLGAEYRGNTRSPRRRHGSRTEAACIGTAGEKLVLYAAIVNGRRTASRGGVGAVMGSKNLKAIAIGGRQSIPKPVNPEIFKDLSGEFVEILKTNPQRMAMTKNGFMVAFAKFAGEMSVTPAAILPRVQCKG
jgi:aldehyde:ferredoxin oxidoreductase